MALINSGDADKVTPLEPGDPVPADAVTQQGSTFAERAAARAKVTKRAVGSDDAEDKAVSSAQTKARSTRKKG